MNDNYKCGIECLKEQVSKKREELCRQADTQRENEGRAQSLREELKGLKRQSAEIEQDSAYLRDTIGLLLSYGGEEFRDPFAREQTLLAAQRRDLQKEVDRIPQVSQATARETEKQLARYDYGEKVLSAYLETGVRPDFGGKEKDWKALFTTDDILGYTCRIAFSAKEEKTDFYEAFLRTPEYAHIPEGRGKRCVDGILIDTLCRNHSGEADRWTKLPLVWDMDCRAGNKFRFAYQLKEAGVLSSGMLALGCLGQRQDLVDYFGALAAGQVDPAAERIMRPMAERGLRGLLNPEEREFFANLELVRQWERENAFWNYRQIAEEELAREKTHSRVETLLKMTVGELLSGKRFGEVADEEAFGEQFVRMYFDGKLKDYLREPHEEWNVTPEEVRRAINQSPEVYAQKETWFRQLQEGEAEAIYSYFESGMYVAERNSRIQDLVMQTMENMLTGDSYNCAEVLERLSGWRGRADFKPYENLVRSLYARPAFQRSLQRSLEELYLGYLVKNVPSMPEPAQLAKKMADLYRDRFLKLESGKWDVKTSALRCTKAGEMEKLIAETQRSKNREKEINKKLNRLRSGQDLSEKDVLWYFQDEVASQAADRNMIRNIRPVLTKMLERELPGTTKTLDLLKSRRSEPNFKPFEATVEDVLARKKGEIRSACMEKISAAVKQPVSNTLAKKYLEDHFKSYLALWDCDSAAILEKIRQWLETDAAKQLVSQEEENERQEARRREKERIEQEKRKKEQERKEKRQEKQQEKEQRRKIWEERFPFGLPDLLLILVGGTGIVTAVPCLFGMEVRGVWKHGKSLRKLLPFLLLRIVLLLVLSVIYQATGGYSLLSQVKLPGLESMKNMLQLGGYVCWITVIVGYLPAVLIAAGIRKIGSTLQKNAENGKGGGQKS